MADSLVTSSYHDYNLKYEELNDKLKLMRKEYALRRITSITSGSGEVKTFAEMLDQEVEKIVLFYLSTQGQLALSVWELRDNQVAYLQDITNISMEGIDKLCQKYRNIGSLVISLLDYLDENVHSLRKIINRHDQMFDVKIGSMYFDTRMGRNNQNSQLLQLYHQEGLRAIIGTIRRGLEELHDAKETLAEPAECLDEEECFFSGPAGGWGDKSGTRIKALPRISFRNKMLSSGNLAEQAIKGKSFGNLEAGLTEKPPMFSSYNKSTGNLFARMQTNPPPPLQRQSSFSALFSSKPKKLKRSLSDLEPFLKTINEAANRVMETQTNSTFEVIALQSKMGLEYSMCDEQAESEKTNKISAADKAANERKSKMGLYVNLFLTFIYLANQYVVAPTSGRYAQLLGLTASTSGLIIGLAPAAALVSSLWYSMWTNYSFKSPLLCCIVCGIVGNLSYAMALQCNAWWMLMAGRLITGFGGPRVISRRYIADHVSLKDRVVASTQFVTAGSMGLACGPLISSLIERSNVDFVWSAWKGSWFSIRYNPETAPGWILCVLWIVSLFTVVFFFHEPTKKYHRDAAPSDLEAISIKEKTESDKKTREIMSRWTEKSETANHNTFSLTNHTNLTKINEQEDSIKSFNSTKQLFQSAANTPKVDPLKVPELQLTSLTSTLTSKEKSEDQLNSARSSQKSNKTSSSVPNSARDSTIKPSKQDDEISEITPLVPSRPRALSSGKKANYPMLNQFSQSADFSDWGNSASFTIPTNFDSDIEMSNRNSDYEAPLKLNSIVRNMLSPFRFIHHLTVEVCLILFLYLINKAGQELTVSSIPLITGAIFNWGGEAAGYYMAVMGALVLPTTILISRMIRNVEERDMVVRLSYVCLLGILFLCHVQFLGPYTILQYVLGSSALFAALSFLEGIIMALLAKLISPELAKGTFNSGLLATEAGTLGRVFGDLTITGLGDVREPTDLANRFFGPLAIGVAFSILLVHKTYDRLTD